MTRRRYVRIRLSDGRLRKIPFSQALKLAREARAAKMTFWMFLELGGDLPQRHRVPE